MRRETEVCLAGYLRRVSEGGLVHLHTIFEKIHDKCMQMVNDASAQWEAETIPQQKEYKFAEYIMTLKMTHAMAELLVELHRQEEGAG